MTDKPAADASRSRRFFRRFLATAAIAGSVIYAFIVLVDPFDALPMSWPFDRGPVDSNARYAFPALARNRSFDSALFGTSTGRLLRPVALDAALGGRFANLAMNSATAYEQTRLLRVFLDAHPRPRTVAIGLDFEWCASAGGAHAFGFDRPLPEWLYTGGRWAGYGHLFNLYALERAGQAFAEWTGLKPRRYGRDGYTRFVPDDRSYDPVRVTAALAVAGPWSPPEPPGPDPAAWPMPGMDLLRRDLATIPADTAKLLFFVPYHRSLLPLAAGPAHDLLAECKRRVTAMAAVTPRVMVVDFMRPSPITLDADNYWDPHHYRVAIAERVVRDLAAAITGAPSPDYAIPPVE